MTLRRVAIGAVAVLVLATGVLAARYQLAQAIDDRVATRVVIAAAEFAPPGPFQWPSRTQDDAISRCDICSGYHLAPGQLTAEYGDLLSDPNMAGFRGTYVPNRDTATTALPLPRLVWIMQWAPTCFEAPPSGFGKCATYELIDDATGWVLDAGRG